MERFTQLRERKKEIEQEIIARNTAVIGEDEFDHEEWLEAEHEAISEEVWRVSELEGLTGGVAYDE